MLPGDRQRFILGTLYIEGYCTRSILHKDFFPSISNSGVGRDLQELEKNNLITYKELKNETGKGANIKCYFLTSQGLGILKKQEQYGSYKKRLSRISLLFIPHYLLVRKIERYLLQSFNNAQLQGVSWNEFNDNGKLRVKTKIDGKFIDIHPDAQIKIKKKGIEFATILLEADRGTESSSVIVKKIKKYYQFFESPIAENYTTVLPMYVLFVSKQERINNILPKAKNCQGINYWLFLAEEQFASNIYRDNVIVNGTKERIALASIIQKREPAITMKAIIKQAAKTYKNKYTIEIYSRFCRSKFPIFIDIAGKTVPFTPDLYLLAFKKNHHSNHKEALFVVVLIIDDFVKFPENFRLYETFLVQRREEISKLPWCYGILIVAQDDDELSKVNAALQGKRIRKRVRIITRKDCQPEKILAKPVWWDHDQNLIPMFPNKPS